MIFKALIAAAACMVATATFAQEAKITILAVDGSGKPIASQRLVVFLGESPKRVYFQQYSMDVITDQNGLATLQLTENMKWLKVFVDYKTLCQDKPNLQSFSLEEIVSRGLAIPNTCSSQRQTAKPGQIVVFARLPTTRERMNW